MSNAGVINFTPFLQSDDEKMSRLIDVNAKSLMWVSVTAYNIAKAA